MGDTTVDLCGNQQGHVDSVVGSIFFMDVCGVRVRVRVWCVEWCGVCVCVCVLFVSVCVLVRAYVWIMLCWFCCLCVC